MTRLLEEQPHWTLRSLLLPHPLPRSYYFKPRELPRDPDRSYAENETFWRDVLTEKVSAERVVHLTGFRLFEWIPRNPGLFHTQDARCCRDEAAEHLIHLDTDRAKDFARAADVAPDHAADTIRSLSSGSAISKRVQIYSPAGKQSMLDGGIGCIRLKPVELISGDLRWFMSASSSTSPDEGIPLAVPNEIYQSCIDQIRETGYLAANIVGRTRFVPEAYSDAFAYQFGIPRIYVEVEHVEPLKGPGGFGVVSVAASFLSEFEGHPGIYATYVSFDPGMRGARKFASEWLQQEYVEGLYRGSILTDFDQQIPTFSNTLFSLDRTVTSPDLAQVISDLNKLYGYFDWSMLERQSINYTAHKEDVMVKIEKSKVVGLAVAKEGSTATATVNVVESLQKINLVELKNELKTLREALENETPSAERDVVKGLVAQAELVAESGDRSAIGTALAAMRPFGNKIIEIAEKIGVGVAIAAIKAAVV